MKERFTSLTPTAQFITFLLFASVCFLVCTSLISLILYNGNRDVSLFHLEAANSYPVEFMLANFLPFQLGFLFIPGYLYYTFTKNADDILLPSSQRSSIWATLLFLSIFLLLPFLTQVNIEIVRYTGYVEQLMQQKIESDTLIQELVGKPNSLSFYVAILIIGVLTGFAEELVFRRFLFHHLLKYSHNLWLSIMISALSFALLHFNLIQLIPLISFGIVFALMYYISGSIWLGVFFHIANNSLNLFWLSNDSVPYWIDEVNWLINSIGILLLIGWIIKYRKKLRIN
ncbi:MAG: CPBP family intramembrane metalloprotease [Brumimicrobium sp.]|nr:CPBP family intramembrane metalloprotease [Brumimicrobium sp.]